MKKVRAASSPRGEENADDDIDDDGDDDHDDADADDDIDDDADAVKRPAKKPAASKPKPAPFEQPPAPPSDIASAGIGEIPRAGAEVEELREENRKLKTNIIWLESQVGDLT